ncbi:MAG: acyltransferase [Calditrichota bacterium]
MKLKLLSLLISSLALPLRIAEPFRNSSRRIFWLIWARGQRSDVPASTQLDGPVRIHGSRRVKFGDHCRIGSHVELQTEEEGIITLGREVRLNRGTTICSYCEVTIGDYSLVGEFVSIRDANHGIEPDVLIRRQSHTSEPIHIGKDVWIGRGACLLPGIEIGDGAVIGANSVVTRSIPAGAIAVGTPAKVLRYRRNETIQTIDANV